MQKHRRTHDYQSSQRSYWNVFRLEMPEAPAQEESAQTTDRDSESPGMYFVGMTEAGFRE
jgi:hypothetical protein